MMMRTIVLAALVLALAVSAAASAQAKIYTWVDDDGVRHYSDTATAPNAKKADLPGVQTIEGDDQALAFAQQQQQKRRAKKRSPPQPPRPPRITSPKARATIRSGDGNVPVTVALGGQGLADGQSLTYMLDGRRTDFSPTTQTYLSLREVERGTHSLSVAITRQGRVLARSRAVTFYMKPPSAITPLNRAPPAAPIAPAAGGATGVNGAPTIGG